MIKIEDLEVGTILRNGSHTRKVLGICGEVVLLSEYGGYKSFERGYTISTMNSLSMTLDEPEKWHDITVEEFPKYFNKQMWFWDDREDVAKKYILRGLMASSSSYININGVPYIHCSPIKPN